MIKKRFSIGSWAKYPTLLVIDNEKGWEYSTTECVNVLNELYEENIMLKERLKRNCPEIVWRDLQ